MLGRSVQVALSVAIYGLAICACACSCVKMPGRTVPRNPFELTVRDQVSDALISSFGVA